MMINKSAVEAVQTEAPEVKAPTEPIGIDAEAKRVAAETEGKAPKAPKEKKEKAPKAPKEPALPAEFSIETHVPVNAYRTHHESQGYTIDEGHYNSKEESKAAADKMRKEGRKAVYMHARGGFFITLSKEAPPKPEKATAKASRPPVPVSFEGKEFDSAKAARLFARNLLEAARNAEFEFDKASK